MKKVLVIIPTYNEAANIKEVVEAVELTAARLEKYNLNILVVDDKSPDGTAKQVKKLQLHYGNIHLLSGKKEGLGKAYMRGFKSALAKKTYDIFIMMDADLSHKPEDIPRLLLALEAGADYAIGSRYTGGGKVATGWPIRRRINSLGANFIVRKFFGVADNVSDLTSGFKAIKVEALLNVDLTKLNAKGYVFQVNLLHEFIQNGCQVAEVPITFVNRRRGSSKMKLRDIIEFLFRTYSLNPNAPVQRFVRFGIVGTCGSLINILLLTILVKVLRLEVLLAFALAIEGSIVFNFILNHIYTFKIYDTDGQAYMKEKPSALIIKLGLFNLAALGGAAISFTVFAMLFKSMHWNYIISDLIAIATAMWWNYRMSTRYVWKAMDRRYNDRYKSYLTMSFQKLKIISLRQKRL